MTTNLLEDFDILDFGVKITLSGCIWQGDGVNLLMPFPGYDLTGEMATVTLTDAEFERVLNQTDVLDVRGPGKAILRKSQRQIDQNISWEVFRRDGYRCRYCGREAPLTVDHIILWEQGGATVADNLISACRRCNKLRGNTEFTAWMIGPDYGRVCGGLTSDAHMKNVAVVDRLPELQKITAKPRSR